MEGIKDSGQRRGFDSGAVRDAGDDKPRPDLFSAFALLRIGRWFAMGARKYNDRNWEKGMPLSVYFASLMRHLLKWAAGFRDEDHMAAVAFNAQAIIDHEERIKLGLMDRKFDDMPNHADMVPESTVDCYFKSLDLPPEPKEIPPEAVAVPPGMPITIKEEDINSDGFIVDNWARCVG